jgi:dihydrofolate synthase / folylpolyglutamate synthase
MTNINQEFKTTLDYLYTQLPMFQRVGDIAFKKDLTNIRRLCKALGDPQHSFKSIHIAGTNGKGSTAHLLSSVFQAAGYKTGLYTSPHYKDFRERIKINGELTSKQFIVDFVKKNRGICEEIKPSFFEITVAMAFEYFRKEQVDIAIIETGLGGRLDSTNIIKPILSIITNISFDHQQFLGNTLKSIAREKAGIIKKGIPVVIGEEQKEVKEVFKTIAKKRKAPISFANRTYKVSLIKTDLSHSYYDVSKRGGLQFENLKVNLHGDYQPKNIATVLKALDNINGFKISEKAIKEGFENLRSLTYYIGRWQQLSEQPLVICDSAHNEAGIKLINKSLSAIPKDTLHFVFGAVNDKDLGHVLTLLPKEAIYYFAKANIPRGLDAFKLQEMAAKSGLKGKTYSSVVNAFKAAKRAAKEKDLVFVGGSIFVVAEVL